MSKFGNLLQQTMSSLQNMSNWQLYQSFTDMNKKLWTKLEMARRRNQIPSTSETNLYFANIMLIAFCVQPPAIFLHSAGKFPSCCLYYLFAGAFLWFSRFCSRTQGPVRGQLEGRGPSLFFWYRCRGEVLNWPPLPGSLFVVGGSVVGARIIYI